MASLVTPNMAEVTPETADRPSPVDNALGNADRECGHIPATSDYTWWCEFCGFEKLAVPSSEGPLVGYLVVDDAGDGTPLLVCSDHPGGSDVRAAHPRWPRLRMASH